MKMQGQYEALERRSQEHLAQLERENTRLRQQNESLQKVAARYRGCFENSPISIVFIRADGRPIQANRAFEQQYGVTIAQLRDCNFNFFNDSQPIEGRLPYMQRALAGEKVMEPMTYDDASKTISGSRCSWGQGLYYPIWDETGAVREIVEMAAGCSQQVEAQQTWLREPERISQERVAQLAKMNQELRQRDRILEATATAANALLSIENFDEAVNTALQIIGEALDTDRVAVIENFESPSESSSVYWRILYEWDSPGTVSQISHPEFAQGSYEGIEDWYELCSRGQGISCLLEEMPEPFRSGQAELGVKALNVVPILVEGKCWGVVGFDDCREAKSRTPAELAVLKTAAACIGGAIQRDRLQRARLQAERQVLLEREKAARERVAELAKANEALKKTLDCLAAQPELDTFLGQVLIILVEQLAGSGGSFWFFDDDELDTEPLLHLDYDRGQIKTTSQTQHPGARSRRPCNEQERQLRQKLRHSKQLLVHDDIANDPALEYYRSHLLARGIESILVIPLVLCNRCIGAFSIRSTQKRQYQREELELAQALAQQVTLAIQLTHLAEQSREAAILEERNRIAQEIHDSLAQAFTGILMQLQAATRFLTSNWEQSQSCITRAQDLARSGLAQARHSVGYLSQSDAQDNDLDLFQTLTHIAEQLTVGTSVQAQVCVEGTPYHLNAEVGMNLLRIAQESLTNALRHSMAQTIQISLIYEAGRLQLRVRDNGQGFDMQDRASSGFGLKGMQQRCDRIGAQLKINTQPGAGTEILVIAPHIIG
jgi:PAS domain S-box-containing protein